MSAEIDAVTESAKAVQETAKAANNGIGAVRDAGGFFNSVFGDAIRDTVGIIWGDKVAIHRIYSKERVARLAHEAQQRLDALGVTELRQVPPKVAIPLIEHATIENEDDLHVLWANLLATGMDANADEIHKKYVSTLADMTSEDAAVLANLVQDCRDPRLQKPTPDGLKVWGPGTDGTLGYDSVSIITLNRLGLIEPSWVKFKTYRPGGHDDRYGDYTAEMEDITVPSNLETVQMTSFGMAFAKAVGLDEPQPASPGK
jgi:hypothetical protein